MLIWFNKFSPSTNPISSHISTLDVDNEGTNDCWILKNVWHFRNEIGFHVIHCSTLHFRASPTRETSLPFRLFFECWSLLGTTIITRMSLRDLLIPSPRINNENIHVIFMETIYIWYLFYSVIIIIDNSTSRRLFDKQLYTFLTYCIKQWLIIVIYVQKYIFDVIFWIA